MKSNVSNVLPKLQEKYPDVDVEFLIKHYFDIAKQEVELFSKPEIAFPWGTLAIKRGKVKYKIQEFDFLEQEYFNGNPRRLNRKNLTEMQIERNELKRILEIYEQYKTNGKTSRNSKRKSKDYC